MIRLAVLAALLGVSGLAAGQPTGEAWRAFDEGRERLNRQAMLVLGGWAVGNIAYGTVAARSSEGAATFFHEGNAIWNSVNLGIAGLGYVSSLQGAATAEQALREHRKHVKLLKVNAVLDVGYMLAGAYLLDRGGRAGDAMLTGYGRALAVQGGFLLGFDVANAVLHEKLLKKHSRAFARLSFSPGGLRMTYNF